MANIRPSMLGKYMLKSCMSKRPAMLQSPQFTRQAKVNGKGMLFAFFVATTVLIVDKGLANNMIQNRTPSFPTLSAGSEAVKDINTIMQARRNVYLICSSMVPGR